MKDINFDLLYSSTLLEGTHSLEDFHAWFLSRLQSGKFNVDQTPLDSLKGWAMDKRSGTYGHESGKFFTINGLYVEREVNEDFKKSKEEISLKVQLLLLYLLLTTHMLLSSNALRNLTPNGSVAGPKRLRRLLKSPPKTSLFHFWRSSFLWSLKNTIIRIIKIFLRLNHRHIALEDPHIAFLFMGFVRCYPHY